MPEGATDENTGGCDGRGTVDPDRRGGGTTGLGGGAASIGGACPPGPRPRRAMGTPPEGPGQSRMIRIHYAAVALTTAVLIPASVWACHEAAPCTSTHPSASEAAASVALRARGLDQGFNLDYEDALASFREAIAADPDNPAGHRLVAATVWAQLLFQLGTVTVDDYLGPARPSLPRTPPRADLDSLFHESAHRALVLSERQLRHDPADIDAQYQLGASLGLLTSYAATIEGHVLSGLRMAHRAYHAHQRVMELDPRRQDAGLTVGMYRYGVSTLPAPLRLLARLAGFGGGREQGLRLVQEAARSTSDAHTHALFALIVMYTREGRFDETLQVIAQLQQRYPRNRLLWLEAGSTAMRADRPAAARHAIEHGLVKLAADARPRAFGEEARWRYYHGAALVALGHAEAAERELRAALAAEAHEWVRGRTHTEIGKIADLSGDRRRALEEYREAARLCRRDRDSTCQDEAEKLVTTPYARGQ